MYQTLPVENKLRVIMGFMKNTQYKILKIYDSLNT